MFRLPLRWSLNTACYSYNYDFAIIVHFMTKYNDLVILDNHQLNCCWQILHY